MKNAMAGMYLAFLNTKVKYSFAVFLCLSINKLSRLEQRRNNLGEGDSFCFGFVIFHNTMR